MHLEGEWWHYNKDGKLLASGKSVNALVDEGEQYFLRCGLYGQSGNVTTYLRLSTQNEAQIGEANALSGVTEVTGSNYAGVAIPSNAVGWTESLNANDYQLAQANDAVYINNSNNAWGAVLSMYLATTTSGNNTGKCICTQNLSTSRTLSQNGDTLRCKLTVKMS
jgi:hypothetical protein